MLFTPIQTGVVIVARNGVYRQCEAYYRGDELYAKGYGGFVRMLGQQTTSADRVRSIEINLPTGWVFSQFGKLTVPDE